MMDTGYSAKIHMGKWNYGKIFFKLSFRKHDN